MVNGRAFRALFACGILLAAALTCAGPALAQSPDERFDTGLTAYEGGRFGEAAAIWSDLARSGVRDPRVEFNLGNALFKTGQIGEAILHWERARRLAPTDRDVRWNLRYARTLIADRTPDVEPGPPLRWVHAAQDTVGPGPQAVVALALWWGIAVVAALAWARPRGFTPAVVWTIAALGVALVLVAGSWWWTWSRLHEDGVAIVLAEAAEVRAGPGENNAGLVQVHEGLSVRVRQRRESWVQIELPDGLNGWVRADVLGEVE
jgi:hypothetical protein